MDSMSLSLDEIIKKKKISNGANKPKFTKKPVKTQGKKFTNEKSFKVVQDVRNKIIQKNRAKIRDAREKLAQIAKQNGDARLKLLKKKKDFKKTNNPKRQNARQPNTYKKAYLAAAAELKSFPRPKPISLDDVPSFRRTVQNDFAYRADADLMPRQYVVPPHRRMLPTRLPQPDWESDPFGCYEVPVSRPHDVSEPKPTSRTMYQDTYPSLRRKIGSIPAYDVGDIPMRNTAFYDRDRIVMEEKSAEKIHLRSQYPTNKTRSVGSYSNAIKQSSKPGYRIVVSNLRGSVSQNDIKELFEDIGELVDARLVKPGVAEVTFAHLRDAENAVDTYHNRQLDGQPMKCLLVNPRNSADKYNRNGNSSSKMEIDIDALHTVLFRR